MRLDGWCLPPSAEALAGCSGPVIAIMQAGQINTGACDPFADLIPAARAHGAWVHVDGAFGLWARACPDRAYLTASAEDADSWATDGHKWLQTPYDCGYAIVRDAEAHRRAMTIAASYLPPVSEGERDPTHFVPELSRRARGFATWAMIKHLGREGIAAMVERHCRLARRIADGLAAEPGLRVLNEVVLNQVIVRFGADEPPEVGDHLTRETIQYIQADGTCFMGGARLARSVGHASIGDFGFNHRRGCRSHHRGGLPGVAYSTGGTRSSENCLRVSLYRSGASASYCYPDSMDFNPGRQECTGSCPSRRRSPEPRAAFHAGPPESH